jgi:hypothetical protein
MWPSATPSRIVIRRSTTWLARGLERLDTLVESICGGAWRLVAAGVQQQPRGFLRERTRSAGAARTANHFANDAIAHIRLAGMGQLIPS